MKALTPELVCVEANGQRHDAKITGYNDKGFLPPAVDGEIRKTAAECGLVLYTRGINFDQGMPLQSDALVKIEEFRMTETKTGTSKNGAEIVRMKPMLDLLVNVGNAKRGPQWNLITGISHKGDVIGAHLMQGKLSVAGGKRYFEELPKPVEVKQDPPKKDK